VIRPHMPWLDLVAHVCRLNPVWTAAFERRLPQYCERAENGLPRDPPASG